MKRIFALVLVCVLCLCGVACAEGEAAFIYTPVEDLAGNVRVNNIMVSDDGTVMWLEALAGGNIYYGLVDISTGEVLASPRWPSFPCGYEFLYGVADVCQGGLRGIIDTPAPLSPSPSGKLWWALIMLPTRWCKKTACGAW